MSNEIPSHKLIQNNAMPCKVAKLNFSGGHEMDNAHRHNCYQMFLFKKGGGEHMIDFNYYPIEDNSLHFVSEGQVHSLNSNETTDGYVILFTKEIVIMNTADKFIFNDFPIFNKSVSPILNPDKEMYADLENMLLMMITEFGKDNAYKENILGSYISILLLKSKTIITETKEYKRTDSSSQELLQKFNNLVEVNFKEYHKVNEYADLLNVTPNHLSETIKKVTGKTAGDIIHERLILEAKRMLLHSSITAKELAYALNFNDPSYFSRFFKANTNLSPEGFRKEIREKYHH
ncbi:MAG: helix-turn-helix domain-containing protein [Bacteroidetes bacterium]|nr:helix-turn-helix domain-containing protein [Bacteroidota bacterium]